MDPFPEAAPLVHHLLREALSAQAPGLYLSISNGASSARISVEGHLRDLPLPDSQPLQPALARIRYMAALKSDPGRFRKGTFVVKLKQSGLQIRVNVFSTNSTAGEKMTVRFELNAYTEGMSAEPPYFDETYGPTFFIGVVNAPSIRNSVMRPRDGFRHLSHQCAGHACSHRRLYGLLLPVSTCPDTAIRSALEDTARSFKGYQGDFPIAELRPALHSATEAFIPMMNVDSAFDWLKRVGFQYVHDDRPTATPNQDALMTHSLGNLTLPLILEKLKAQGVLSDPSELTIAFAYFNSD